MDTLSVKVTGSDIDVYTVKIYQKGETKFINLFFLFKKPQWISLTSMQPLSEHK